MLQNKQVTIVTIHNYSKGYKVEGNVSFQHIGEDWWRKLRVVELYKNFYAKLSFLKRAGYKINLCTCLKHTVPFETNFLQAVKIANSRHRSIPGL